MAHMVDLPNGDTAEFPDEMSPEQITGVLQKRFSSSNNQQLDASQEASNVPLPQTAQGRVEAMNQKYIPGGPTIHEMINQSLPAGAVAHGVTSFLGKLIPGFEKGMSTFGAKIASRPIVNALANASSTGLETGAINALQHPEDRVKSGLEGFALGSALHGVQGVGNALKPSNFLANNFASEITNKLGQGAMGLRDNALSLSNDLKNSYNSHIQNYQDIKNPIMQKFGKQEIYPLVDTGYQQFYRDIPEINLKNGGKVVKDLHKRFTNEPTLENADNLQTALGKKIGDIKAEAPSRDKSVRLNRMNAARESIKSEMDTFLRKIDPESANNLSKASDYYRDNVIPYRSNNQLRGIVEGKPKASIKNIHNIFDTANVDMQKIGLELPQEAKNKIIFSAIRGNKNDANELLKMLEKKQSGLTDYFSPELGKDINTLRSKIKYDKIGKYIGLGTLGALAGASAVSGVNKVREVI